MLGRLRSWFDNLSGPKKVGAGIVAIATAVGVITGAVNGSIALYKNLAGPSSHVEFVDVGFLGSRISSSPQLDIKLANTGEGTAFVTRADFHVKEVRKLTPPYQCPDCAADYFSPSYEYTVKLPASGAPYNHSLNLSQEIAPNDVDRFLIDLILENREPFTDYIFLVTLSLVYDEDGKKLSKDILFAPPIADKTAYTGADKNWMPREGLEDSDAARLNAQNKEPSKSSSRLRP